MGKINIKTKELLQKIYTSQYSHNTLLPGPFGDKFITYADYVASGQSLTFIEQFIEQSVLPSYANTHTESSYTGLQTSKLREEARDIIKASVQATEEDVIVFTGAGSTGAIDLLNRKLTQLYKSQPLSPVVLIGPYEHHSNIPIPYIEVASYQPSMFYQTAITFCRPGLGIVSDLLSMNIPIIPIAESDNQEIIYNSTIINKISGPNRSQLLKQFNLEDIYHKYAYPN